MTAFEIPGTRFSGVAAENIERRVFVKVNSNEEYAKAGDGDKVVGVSMNDPKAKEVLEIADGIVMVKAGEAITAGAEVKPNASGHAVTASGDGIGIALTTAKSGGLVTIKL